MSTMTTWMEVAETKRGVVEMLERHAGKLKEPGATAEDIRAALVDLGVARIALHGCENAVERLQAAALRRVDHVALRAGGPDGPPRRVARMWERADCLTAEGGAA